MLDAYLAIGEITRPQGVRGEVKVRPLTSDPLRYEGLRSVFLESGGRFSALSVELIRADKDAVYLRVEGVSDRTAAESLRGRLLYVERAHATPLGEDEAYIVDLIGCIAVDDAGVGWGALTEVLQPGGGDVYVFSGPRGRLMVPALKSVVLEVDTLRKHVLLSAGKLREVAVFDEN